MTDTALRRISEGLCLLGVGIAGYLTYVHYAGLRPICEIGHGCETVQTSRYANLLGKENIVASVDCGLGGRCYPDIGWAKLRSLVEGARLASRQLWGT